MKLQLRITALACSLILGSLAQARLVEDHSDFNGKFNLVDGNVKYCAVQLILKGSPDTMKLNDRLLTVTERQDPDSLPRGFRDEIFSFLSADEFKTIFVDNIDVANQIVTIESDYKINAQNDLDVVTINSFPDIERFPNTPARSECHYTRDRGY